MCSMYEIGSTLVLKHLVFFLERLDLSVSVSADKNPCFTPVQKDGHEECLVECQLGWKADRGLLCLAIAAMAMDA